MANEGTPGDYFRRQLLRYRDLLANFSKRNKELYFRPGKGSSLNLSIYQMSRSGANEGATENSEPMANEAGEIREEKEFEFIPLTINSLKAVELTKTSTIDLTEHFDLRDNPNKQIEKRLEKIRSADSRYQKEFGISGAWLLGPFLLWRDSPNAPPEELLISPIFKLPIDLTLSKQKRWELKIEEAELGVNPSLQLALSKRIGLTIPDEIEADTLYGAVSTILSKLASNGRQVTVISTAESEYRFANGGLLQKEEITPLSKSVESGLAKIRLDVASKAKRKHGLKLPSILGKQKVEKDADGNIIGRRATSLADDLTEAEQCYYSAASFEHFIVVDAFYIDHVSATRMPLFRDYEQVMADLTNHQLITELLGQGPLPTGSDKAKLPRELDRYRERENFFVIPTDSSQHAAINLCSKSPAIVIQGPPGTGKSQTISNLIADKIANGKKVLFVAEKRAALDVVYTRLKQAGIDKQAVLIHSSEINKKELYTSFLELADSKPREDDKAGWDRVTNKLDRIKEEVHGYYDAAAQPFRDTGLTNSDVLALFAANSTGEQSSDNTEIGDHFAKHVKGHDLDELVTELGKLQTLIQSLGNLENHPWANKKHDLVITAPKISALRSVHSNINKSIDEMSLIESKMKAIFPAVQMSNLARLSFPLAEGISHKLIDAIKVLLLSANPEEKVQSLKNQIDELMSALRDSWKDYRKFKADADHDLLNELKTYVKIPRGIFARMSQSYWRMKRVCRAVMTDDGFVSTSFSNMDERPIKHFDGHKVNLDKLFTSSDLSFIWSGFKKEGASFEDFEETVKAANKCLDEARSAIETLSRLGVTALASKVFENLESAKSFAIKVKEAESLSARIATISSSCNQEASLLNEFFEEPPNLGNGEPKTILNWISQLLERVSDCEIIERIELICHNFGERNGLPGFRRAILPRLLPLSEAWGERTKREICRIWYDEVRSTNIQVRGFDRKLFEDTVHEFKNIETAHCEAARIAVNDQFARRWTSKAPDYTAIALLKKESTKQRRILYPREVMEKGALETMLRLKPCWLMSPLSVSQILPLVKEMFDVIVFDEASQVRVEDAIPAIYRASTMVVVGDPKQMPPTNFFLGGGGDEPDDDEEEETDLAESILDLAARIYPAQMLEWHYRSKSEALIAFSNRAFYGGRLIAAPNPTNLGQDGSLMFVPVKDAIFNQKQGNTIEAETVIDHLEKILKENPNQSVGVISMGQSQRDA